MALANKRKAAMLLMSLEPSVAAELLRATEPQAVTEIAAELAYLDSSGYDGAGDEELAREFVGLLGKGGDRQGEKEVSFLRKVVESAFDSRKSAEILEQVDHLVKLQDPFAPVRDSGTDKIAEALRGESPQVAAMVLAELPPKKSISLLEMLGEDVRAEAVCGMATGDTVAAEAKLRVATAVHERLVGLEKGETPETPPGAEAPPEQAAPEIEVPEETREEKLRRVALLLRGLKLETRDELLAGIAGRNEEISETVRNLMIVWEDLPLIGERSLQNMVREVDSRKLALALTGADQTVVDRIRENMSARAGAMLDEEASLLGEPKDDEIDEAREAILGVLRDLNTKGELELEEPEEE